VIECDRRTRVRVAEARDPIDHLVGCRIDLEELGGISHGIPDGVTANRKAIDPIALTGSDGDRRDNAIRREVDAHEPVITRRFPDVQEPKRDVGSADCDPGHDLVRVGVIPNEVVARRWDPDRPGEHLGHATCSSR
jgi:hypothetical protein